MNNISTMLRVYLGWLSPTCYLYLGVMTQTLLAMMTHDYPKSNKPRDTSFQTYLTKVLNIYRKNTQFIGVILSVVAV